MHRLRDRRDPEGCIKGFFVSFDSTTDALREILGEQLAKKLA